MCSIKLEGRKLPLVMRPHGVGHAYEVGDKFGPVVETMHWAERLDGCSKALAWGQVDCRNVAVVVTWRQ